MSLFKVYLKKYQFHPYIHIADQENRKLLDNEFTKNDAKIYFFVKSKSTFDRLSIDGFKVSGILNNKGIKYDIKFYIYDYLSDLLLNIYDENKNNIRDYINSRDSQKILEYILKNLGKNELSYTQEVDLSLGNSLFFYKDPILENNTYPVHLYQLINSKLVNLPDELETEIYYIGKTSSQHGILKGRIFNHEKPGIILGQLGMKNDYLSAFMFEVSIDCKFPDENSSMKEIYIPCIEEILIRHFRPSYNKDYITTKKGQSEHIKKLIDLGFSEYLVELNFDDAICRFGNSNIPYSKKHFICGKTQDLHEKTENPQ